MFKFQNVEYKVLEADFFLDKALNSRHLTKEAGYYMSAYLSASRSITFTLQAQCSKLDGFDEWYKPHQDKLRESRISKFFVEARNKALKVGEQLQSTADYQLHTYTNSTNGPLQQLNQLLYDNGILGPKDKDFPDMPVFDSLRIHMKNLIEVIWDFYEVYGSIICPLEYYQLTNLKKIGKSLEDIEGELGFEREWTLVEGATEEERLNTLVGKLRFCGLDPIFHKYLDKTRAESLK